MIPRALIEFPADDPERARSFWQGVLGVELAGRTPQQGAGWETPGPDGGDGVAVGVHARGAGPGDTRSLPYFSVADLDAAVARVAELGGAVIHRGERWTICRDSEGSPFALAAARNPAD